MDQDLTILKFLGKRYDYYPDDSEQAQFIDTSLQNADEFLEKLMPLQLDKNLDKDLAF